jgi:hypothetical protein
MWTKQLERERPRTVCVRSAAAETTEIAGMSSRPDPEAAEEEATMRTGRELGLSLGITTAATPMVALSRVLRAATDRETTGCRPVPGHRTALGTDVEAVAVETRTGDLERVDPEDINIRKTVASRKMLREGAIPQQRE